MSRNCSDCALDGDCQLQSNDTVSCGSKTNETQELDEKNKGLFSREVFK